MKDRYDDNSASSDPYENKGTDEEGGINDYTHKLQLSRTQESNEVRFVWWRYTFWFAQW